MKRRLSDVLAPIFLVVAGLMLVRAPFLIRDAPFEASMGVISKIFYFHVPVAMTFMLSAFVCGIASVVYLAKRTPTADHVALIAAELTVVFGLMVLGTGPFWARKAWGVWWVWEARLTITLVMWMVYVAYLLLRRFGGSGSEVLAAAVAVFGMALVPFVYWSVNLWRTMHPSTNVLRTLPGEMWGPILWCFCAFVCLYVGTLLVGAKLERSRATLEEAYVMLEELT